MPPLVALLAGMFVLIPACSTGSKLDTAARDRCEAKWGVGNCVERNEKWVPLAAATSTTAPASTSSSATAPSTTAPIPTTAATTTTTMAPAKPAEDVLRTDGLGALELGMSVADAVATGAVGDPSASITESMDVMGVACGFGYPVGAGPDGPWSAQFADLSEGGAPVLIRLDVTSADVKTPEGLGVGSRPGEIRAAYPTSGSMQEGEYSGFNLTVPIGGGGYLFTFDEPDGQATAVAAGTAEGLSLVEGCA
jgi:hypothetical protein